MLELMGLMEKMVLCLVVALLLGFLIGWLFSKALSSESEDGYYLDGDSNDYHHKSQEWELKYLKEKKIVSKYEKKNRELKGELMKKMNLLQNTSDSLKNIQSKNSDENKFIDKKMNELEQKLKRKEAELLEFETVLLKAEETIEAKDRIIKELSTK